MSELMYKDNIQNITNIDISDVVINQMNELYKENFDNMKCNLKLYLCIKFLPFPLSSSDGCYKYDIRGEYF
jgi:hypothetical protein